MCKNIIFTFSTKTFEGYPVIGAGICDMIYKNHAIQSFSQINQIKLGATNLENPYEIDFLLNSKIASLAPDYVDGLGLSIKVDNAMGPTGGIIGIPNNFGSTADGLCNNIGNGLSTVALPGGPGMLIEGSTNTLKSIFTNITIGENKLVSLKRILEELKAHKINLAIIVTDGTGKGQHGMILTYYNDRMEKLVIDG